jgi:hypothetical protein
LSEERKAEIEKIQDMSLSYRIYLLSRRDFLSGVLIGVASSLALGYLTQLDATLNKGELSAASLGIRVLVSCGALGYLVYGHRKRTQGYETLLNKMSIRIQRLSEEPEAESRSK